MFCSASCRAKFSRRGAAPSGRAAASSAPVDDEAREERRRTLEELYASLKADVDRLGTLITDRSGRVRQNPSAPLLVRVVGELERLSPAPAEENPDEDEIDAALRIA